MEQENFIMTNSNPKGDDMSEDAEEGKYNPCDCDDEWPLVAEGGTILCTQCFGFTNQDRALHFLLLETEKTSAGKLTALLAELKALKIIVPRNSAPTMAAAEVIKIIERYQ